MSKVLGLLDLPRSRLRATVRLSSELNCLYLNVPKAGCTNIKRGLWEASGGVGAYRNNDQFNADHVASFKYLPEHLQSTQNPFVFSISRNPFARIYSAYWDKVITAPARGKKLLREIRDQFLPNFQPEFKVFLNYLLDQDDWERNPHFRSMSFQMNLDFIEPDFVGSIEAMGTSLSIIENRLGVKPDWRTAVNSKNSNSSFFKAYDSETEELVRQLYPRDFEQFGYSLNIETAFDPPIHKRGGLQI